MTLSAAAVAEIESRHPLVFRGNIGRRILPFAVVLGLILYGMFCWWFFSIGTVFSKANWSIAGNYLSDWVAYEISPTIRLSETGAEVTYAKNSPLGAKPNPDWVTRPAAGMIDVDFGSGTLVQLDGTIVTVTHAGETLQISMTPEGPLALGALPAWAIDKQSEIDLSFGFAGRADVRANKIVLNRRFLGWANFLFDTRSPFWGRSPGEVIAMIAHPVEIKPGVSNLRLAFDNIWNNSEWQHGDVWTKLLQTIVMAFVGTLIATLVGLPLAFFAARNITPNRLANQVFKRFFDFTRSVDMLIWALFFTRAFGPGPIAGIAAIAVTDTGTLGKLYSEALENIDDKQREGIKSTGASPLLVQRYGVIPQVLPVLLSQALYLWESNTRSATIIGAVGAGGIGLKLWEAMRTNSDWENVAYMVLLILIVVFVFDNISNALRSRLIGKRQ